MYGLYKYSCPVGPTVLYNNNNRKLDSGVIANDCALYIMACPHAVGHININATPRSRTHIGLTGTHVHMNHSRNL